MILSAGSQSPRRPSRGMFRSRGKSRIECSTNLLSLASESTGSHMNRLSEDPFGDSESWNVLDLHRDHRDHRDRAH